MKKHLEEALAGFRISRKADEFCYDSNGPRRKVKTQGSREIVMQLARS
jgi:hypothetical protein